MLNGKKIRELRLKLGYTALDVEKITKNPKYQTSISKSYLEELERGDKQNPTLKKITVLANVLGCKLDDLILQSEH